MNFIKKNLLAVVAVLVLLLAGGWYVASQDNSKQGSDTNVQQEQKSQATVVINDGTSSKDYTVENTEGKTALEVTRLATSEVELTGEGENAFITSINGREASTEKKEFWKLVINGEDAQVGAGSYVVKNGDKIQWEIDTY